METEIRSATAYEALGVDPCAPIDLISASYWNLVKELQTFREYDARIATMLHHAMRAYETLTDPETRKAYDESIGMKQEPLTKRKFHRAKTPRLGFLPGRKKLRISADPYEVMGLHPTTLQSSIPDAYRAMKQQYLRLPPESRRRAELLRVLDESYAALNDPEKRAMYDEGAAKAVAAAAAEAPAKPVIEPILIEDDEGEAVIEEAAAPETVPAEEIVAAEPEAVAAEAAVEEEAAPPAAMIPDPSPSQAGRLRRTAVKPEMDDLAPPVPVFSPARPRRAKVEGDVEALMLSRLEARMNELAAFGGSSEPTK